MSPEGWRTGGPAAGTSCSSRGASAHAGDQRGRLTVDHRVPGAASVDNIDPHLGALVGSDQPGHDLRLEY
jgi:hypothetical protein